MTTIKTLARYYGTDVRTLKKSLIDDFVRASTPGERRQINIPCCSERQYTAIKSAAKDQNISAGAILSHIIYAQAPCISPAYTPERGEYYLTAKISPRCFKLLKNIAAHKHMTMASLIRQAIELNQEK